MLNEKKLFTKILEAIANDEIRVISNVTLGSSGSISAGGTCPVIETDVSSHIPQGYKLLLALFRGTSNHNAYCWYFSFIASTNVVEYRLHNAGASALTTSPTAHLVCIKE